MKRIFDKIGAIEVRPLIAIMSLIGAFAFLFSLLHYPVPKENETLINVISGVLIVSSIGAVLSFYFGASKQSYNNNEGPH